MKKHILIASAICIVLVVGATAYVNTGTPPPPAGGSVPTDPKPTSLREGARHRGHKVLTARPKNLRKYDNVAKLVRDSTAIVVGRPEQRASQLRQPAEDFVDTDYQVRVTEVLDGQPRAGETITVVTPGGVVQFPDGSSAEVRMPEFWRDPQVGKNYVFFLRQKGEKFLLVGGPQGLFEITARGGVEPQVRPEDELSLFYGDKNLSFLLRQIRSVLEHSKKRRAD